jgi:hypothetical protein
MNTKKPKISIKMMMANVATNRASRLIIVTNISKRCLLKL